MTAEQKFAPNEYKQTPKKPWNDDAEAWHRWGATLQNWFSDVTEIMLNQSAFKPKDQILDIATGTGEPALSAAERIKPGGCVLATDLSENLLQFAQQIANDRGLSNFKTQVMDAENLDLPDNAFDVVLCRFGLFYLPNRQQALSEWRRVLKPGGKLVVAVFSTAAQNGWGAVPIAIIRQRAQLGPPIPGQPGPFSLGDPGVLEQTLEEAGFLKVTRHLLTVPLKMESAKQYARFARESFRAFNQMMCKLSEKEREDVWNEVAQAMRPFETENGFEAPCESIVGVGIK